MAYRFLWEIRKVFKEELRNYSLYDTNRYFHLLSLKGSCCIVKSIYFLMNRRSSITEEIVLINLWLLAARFSFAVTANYFLIYLFKLRLKLNCLIVMFCILSFTCKLLCFPWVIFSLHIVEVMFSVTLFPFVNLSSLPIT